MLFVPEPRITLSLIYFDFKVKTSEETLQNIYAIVLDIAKKYNIENNI